MLREIGRGGMGVVYEAEQVSLGRRVALKVLEAHLTLQPEAVQRFHREAAAAAGLRHPNILPVHFIGEEDGTHYFAMDLVHGWSLERLLQELRAAGRPWFGAPTSRAASPAAPQAAPRDVPAAWLEEGYRDPTARVCDIAIQVAAALEYGHERHILHRDVKSSNVLIQEDGTVLLIDYGLARDLELPALTQPGQVVGSPYTLAPEQISGARDALDARVDVYALGVLLYELLTLCRPFDGNTAAEVLDRIQNRDPVPPRRLRRGVPRDLQTICLKALSKPRDGRYRSARSLQQDLERVRAGLPIRARPVGPLARGLRAVRQHPLRAAAGLVGVAALAVAAYLWTHRDGALVVHSEPAGAHVVLQQGGAPVELGTTPLLERLPPGRYVLEFSLPGFPPATQPVELGSGESVAVEQCWPLSELAVQCPQPGAVLTLFAGSRCRGTPVSVHALPLDAPLVVPAGQYALRLAVPGHDAACLEGERALRLAAGERSVASLWCAPVRTRFRCPLPEPVQTLDPGDFDGDGVLEVLAVGASWLGIVNAQGQVLWEEQCSDEVHAAALLDLDADGSEDVLLGDIRGGVRGITAAGSHEERWQMEGAVKAFAPAAGNRGGVAVSTDLGEVWSLECGRAAQRCAAAPAAPEDVPPRRTELGEPILCSLGWSAVGLDRVVATQSGRILGFDAEGGVRLEAGVDAPVLQLAAVNLDGRGRDGLVVLSDREWRVLRPDGLLRLRVPCPQRLRVLAAADLDADGREEVLGATDDGALLAWELDSERSFEWDLEDFDLAAVMHPPRDPDALLLVELSEPRGRVVDARGEVLWKGAVPASSRLLAASFQDPLPRLFLGGRAGLFALDVGPGGRWMQVVPDAVSALAAVESGAAEGPALVLATEEGSLVALDSRGVVLFDLGVQNHDAFQFLSLLDLEHDGVQEVLAASRRGTLVVLRETGVPVQRARLPAAVLEVCSVSGPERDAAVVLLEDGELWAVHSREPPQRIAVIPEARLLPARVRSASAEPLLAVGCEGGRVRFLALDGEEHAAASLPEDLLALECGDLDGDGRADAAVATAHHWFVLNDLGERILERPAAAPGERLWIRSVPQTGRDELVATEGARAVALHLAHEDPRVAARRQFLAALDSAEAGRLEEAGSRFAAAGLSWLALDDSELAAVRARLAASSSAACRQVLQRLERTRPGTARDWAGAGAWLLGQARAAEAEIVVDGFLAPLLPDPEGEDEVLRGVRRSLESGADAACLARIVSLLTHRQVGGDQLVSLLQELEESAPEHASEE